LDGVRIREKLTVNKQRLHTFHTRDYLKELNEIKGKEQYRVEVSNRFGP
jgi:hypothetical protein